MAKHRHKKDGHGKGGKHKKGVTKLLYHPADLTAEEIKTFEANVRDMLIMPKNALDKSYYDAKVLDSYLYKTQLASATDQEICRRAISSLANYQAARKNEPQITVYLETKQTKGQKQQTAATVYFPDEDIYLMDWYHPRPDDPEFCIPNAHCGTSLDHLVQSILLTSKQIAYKYGDQDVSESDTKEPEYNSGRQHAAFLHRFGIALLRSKYSETALSRHQDALKIMQEEYGDTHPEVAFSYGHICAHHVNTGDMEKAREYAYTALSVMRKVLQQASKAAEATVEDQVVSQVKTGHVMATGTQTQQKL